ncbi:MAG: DUF4912 domain-containing protein [Spirochaetales bacterium]|nr:DUF4912 domain-containing protein [Spirochaetales bacterium]
MTRDRLSSYSLFDLYKIAENKGIKYNYSDANREELVEIILDAFEEDENEREITNNAAMQLKSKKYDILQDYELEAQEKKVYSIPDRYNETRIVLLLRDPHWAYTYWDLNENMVSELKNELFFEGFFLRVFELKEKKSFGGDSYTKDNILDYYDIPVDEGDDSWYINLGKIGKFFGIELCSLVYGKEKILSRSNIIKSPRGFVAENIENISNDPGMMTLLLSGLWDYNVKGENVLPQRIISIMESQDLSFNN